MPLIVREIAGPTASTRSRPTATPARDVAGARRRPGRAVDWRADRAGQRLRPRPARRPRPGSPARASARASSSHDPGAAAQVAAERSPSRSARNERAGWPVERCAGPGVERRGRATRFERRLHGDDATRSTPPSATSSRRVLRRAALPSSAAGCCVARPRRASAGAGAIAAVSDGFLHYYLGGTADARSRGVAVQEPDRRDARPRRRARAAAQPRRRRHARRRARGVQARLRQRELPFRTHELVCDPAAYESSRRRPRAGEFFPAYRRRADATSAWYRRRAALPRGGGGSVGVVPRPVGIDALLDQAPDLRDLGSSASPGHSVRPTVPWPMTLFSAHPAPGRITARLAAGRGQRRLAGRVEPLTVQLPGEVADDQRFARLGADRVRGVVADRGDAGGLRVEALGVGADHGLGDAAGAARVERCRSGRRARCSRCRSSRCRCGGSGRCRARSPAPRPRCSCSWSPCGGRPPP